MEPKLDHSSCILLFQGLGTRQGQGQRPTPELQAIAEATASLLLAPLMLKVTGLKTERPHDPL